MAEARGSFGVTRTLLFLPNYLGGGFGHIGRCLALAEAWTQRGGKSAFVMNGPHFDRVARAGYATHHLDTPKMSSSNTHAVAYTYIPDMSYQLVRDGFDHPRVVERALREALDIVQRVRPDVLVADGWPIARLVAQRAGLPLVQLVKSVVHPQPNPMTPWEDTPNGLITPDVQPVINPVLHKLGLPSIDRAEELLDGELLLLPSIPPLDPMQPLPEKTHYVGPIVRKLDQTQVLPDWLTQLDRSRPVVYITIGGAAGGSGSLSFFRLIAETFGDCVYQVIVSTGGKVDPQQAGAMPSNVRLERWIPNHAMLTRSDTAVFHGGYTRMEVLAQGLPSVVIPFHSEQEYYGRLMADAGAASVVPYSDEAYHCHQARWRGGGLLKNKRFTVSMRLRPTLRPETLRVAVERSLSDPAMRRAAQALQSELATYAGCEQALDLMQAHLSLH